MLYNATIKFVRLFLGGATVAAIAMPESNYFK
jgi:hypothetical protein